MLPAPFILNLYVFFFSFYVLLLSLLLRLSLVDVTTHFVSILILTLFRFKDFCCAIFYARAFPFQFFMPLHSLPAQGLGHCPRQTLHSIRVYVCICVCVCGCGYKFVAIHCNSFRPYYYYPRCLPVLFLKICKLLCVCMRVRVLLFVSSFFPLVNSFIVSCFLSSVA